MVKSTSWICMVLSLLVPWGAAVHIQDIKECNGKCFPFTDGDKAGSTLGGHPIDSGKGPKSIIKDIESSLKSSQDGVGLRTFHASAAVRVLLANSLAGKKDCQKLVQECAKSSGLAPVVFAVAQALNLKHAADTLLPTVEEMKIELTSHEWDSVGSLVEDTIAADAAKDQPQQSDSEALVIITGVYIQHGVLPNQRVPLDYVVAQKFLGEAFLQQGYALHLRPFSYAGEYTNIDIDDPADFYVLGGGEYLGSVPLMAMSHVLKKPFITWGTFYSDGSLSPPALAMFLSKEGAEQIYFEPLDYMPAVLSDAGGLGGFYTQAAVQVGVAPPVVGNSALLYRELHLSNPSSSRVDLSHIPRHKDIVVWALPTGFAPSELQFMAQLVMTMSTKYTVVFVQTSIDLYGQRMPKGDEIVDVGNHVLFRYMEEQRKHYPRAEPFVIADFGLAYEISSYVELFGLAKFAIVSTPEDAVASLAALTPTIYCGLRMSVTATETFKYLGLEHRVIYPPPDGSGGQQLLTMVNDIDNHHLQDKKVINKAYQTILSNYRRIAAETVALTTQKVDKSESEEQDKFEVNVDGSGSLSPLPGSDTHGKLNVVLHAQSLQNATFIAGSEVTTAGMEAALRRDPRIGVTKRLGPGVDYDEELKALPPIGLVIVEGMTNTMDDFLGSVKKHHSKAKVVYWNLSFFGLSVAAERQDRFDAVMTNSKAMVKLFEKILPTEFVMLAADPELFKPIPAPVAKYQSEVAFLGLPQDRDSKLHQEPMLKEALSYGLSIYGGEYWENPENKRFHSSYKGLLPFEDICQLYGSSKVVLGTTATSQLKMGMINNRVFEALACGSTLLNDYSPELEEIFGDEISYYRWYGDTTMQLESILNKGTPLSKSGRETVLNGHTYDHRVKDLFRLYRRLHKGTYKPPKIEASPQVLEVVSKRVYRGVYIQSTEAARADMNVAFDMCHKLLVEAFSAEMKLVSLEPMPFAVEDAWNHRASNVGAYDFAVVGDGEVINQEATSMLTAMRKLGKSIFVFGSSLKMPDDIIQVIDSSGVDAIDMPPEFQAIMFPLSHAQGFVAGSLTSEFLRFNFPLTSSLGVVGNPRLTAYRQKFSEASRTSKTSFPLIRDNANIIAIGVPTDPTEEMMSLIASIASHPELSDRSFAFFSWTFDGRRKHSWDITHVKNLVDEKRVFSVSFYGRLRDIAAVLESSSAAVVFSPDTAYLCMAAGLPFVAGSASAEIKDLSSMFKPHLATKDLQRMFPKKPSVLRIVTQLGKWTEAAQAKEKEVISKAMSDVGKEQLHHVTEYVKAFAKTVIHGEPTTAVASQLLLGSSVPLRTDTHCRDAALSEIAVSSVIQQVVSKTAETRPTSMIQYRSGCGLTARNIASDHKDATVVSWEPDSLQATAQLTFYDELLPNLAVVDGALTMGMLERLSLTPEYLDFGVCIDCLELLSDTPKRMREAMSLILSLSKTVIYRRPCQDSDKVGKDTEEEFVSKAAKLIGLTIDELVVLDDGSEVCKRPLMLVKTNHLNRYVHHHFGPLHEMYRFYNLTFDDGEVFLQRHKGTHGDGKKIKFTYAGVNIHTLVQLGLSQQLIDHFFKEYLDFPVYQDMSPWNVLLYKGRLHMVDIGDGETYNDNLDHKPYPAFSPFTSGQAYEKGLRMFFDCPIKAGKVPRTLESCAISSHLRGMCPPQEPYACRGMCLKAATQCSQ